ncbi:MAG TPA: PLD nuclease N-terminal domain-containing protein [Actinomycetales bacterium]|nr:PLD nuclease N-terminal domain-containing protein [Actinomycetales bacterium]
MQYSFWQIIAWMFWFMLLVAWIWLLIAIVTDIFRDHELSGWGKAGWTLFLIVLPWLGALMYLIIRGRSMNERAMRQAQVQEAQAREFIRSSVPTPSTADEIGKLADLHHRGLLSDAEYEEMKAGVLAAGRTGPTPPTVVTPRQPA